MTIPNHAVDASTGFLESNAYLQAFDADKKQAFLKLFFQHGLRLYRTCAELGVKADTVHKHAALDPVFKEALDQVKREYYDELEGTSRINALNPRSVIERIFQLKAAFPDKYGDNKRSDQSINISLNFDGKTLEMAKQRAQVIEAEIVDNQQAESARKAEGAELPIITTARTTTNT